MGQYPPGQTFRVLDGQMNLPAGITDMPMVVGVTSSGTEGGLYACYSSNSLVNTLGRGPAVNAAAPLADSGGVLVLKTAGSTAAANSAVTKSAIGSSTGTITVAGTVNDNYRPLVKITATGTVGVGRFMYALDRYSATEATGWSPEYVIPAGGTFVCPNTGITLTFVPGAGAVFFEAGDKHRFDCTAAHYTSADLTAAFTNILTKLGSVRPSKINFTGLPASATAAITLLSAAAGHLDNLFAAKRFCHAVMDGGSLDTIANYRTAIAAFEDDRIGVIYDPITSTTGCRITSKIPFVGFTAPISPFGDAVFERWARAKLDESPARVMSGSLRGVVAIGNDEKLNQQFLAGDRTITACTNDGYPGYFVTKPWIRSSPSSSFRTLQWGAVLDKVCDTAYVALQPFVESNMQTETDGTGRLTEAESTRVEDCVNTALKEAIMEPTNAEGRKGFASACGYTVTRTNNFLTDGTIFGFAAAVPTREVEGIDTTAALVASMGAE